MHNGHATKLMGGGQCQSDNPQPGRQLGWALQVYFTKGWKSYLLLITMHILYFVIFLGDFWPDIWSTQLEYFAILEEI